MTHAEDGRWPRKSPTKKVTGNSEITAQRMIEDAFGTYDPFVGSETPAGRELVFA